MAVMPAQRRRSGRRSLRLRVLARVVVVAFVLVALAMTGCMERLFYVPTRGATPPPPHLAGAETVRFSSADGTRLTGWFVPSLIAPARGSILHVHGNAGNIASHIWFTQHLPAAGYDLFIFDYRGYGESEGRARRRGPLIADTHAALDTLLARDDVDPQRIGLYGQSLGGSIGLLVMAERPELRAAVIESPFSGWREIAACVLAGGDQPGWLARASAALLIHGGERPLDAIARIDRPILLVHGSDDSIIPARHSHDLHDAAPDARLAILEGGDHNTLRQSNPEIDGMVVAFYGEQLAGGPVESRK